MGEGHHFKSAYTLRRPSIYWQGFALLLFRYKERLAVEKEEVARLQGQNGLLKSKIAGLATDLARERQEAAAHAALACKTQQARCC